MQKRVVVKLLGCVLFLALVRTNAFAQKKPMKLEDGSLYGYDSGYVISFRNNLIITVVNETKSSEMLANFIYRNNSYSLDYKTNALNTWGLGFDYKWLTFEYTKRMPWYTPDATMGEVKNSGFGFGLTGRRLAFRNFFENTKGYYLANTDSWLKEYQEQKGTYYIRPDIGTYTYFASLNYVFNNKHFSNNASLWQLERQQKRAFSVVAGLTYVYSSFSADSSIIPTTGVDTFPRSNNTYFALNSVGLNCGFLGTIPIGKQKKWFITMAFEPGLSRQWGQVTVESVGVAKAQKLLGFQSEFRLGFGYNGDKWYIGSVAKTYANLNAIDHPDPMSISHTFGRIYFGYRFNEIKINSPLLKKLRL